MRIAHGRSGTRWMAAASLLLATLVLGSGRALAHCDGVDGPVVAAARQALEMNEIGRALIWVRAGDESEIRKAFEQAKAVRRLGPQARSLADTYFFETLVRVHRAGEGAPYTGLKPAGRDLGPAIPAADRALESGDVEPLLRLVTTAARDGVRQHFVHARTARARAPGDVEAGRRFVAEYVTFIHYVERLYQSSTSPISGHEPASSAEAAHEH